MWYEKCSSSLYRKMPDDMRESREAPALQTIYRDLIVESAAKHVDFKEEEDILAKVRHYGGFTNLIDFTGNYLVALFFACRSDLEKDGRLVLLSEMHKENEYTVCIPKIKDRRLLVQSGVFVNTAKGYIDNKDLEIILIRHEDKEGIMDYLSRHHSILESSLFNDLHGFIDNQGEILKTVPFFNKGLQAMKRKNWNEGIKQFTKVVDMHPRFYLAHYNRGLAYSGMGNIEQAIADYSKAIDMEPKFTNAYNSRGLAYSGTGNIEQAIADYSKAIELDLEYTEAYSNRGLAYNGTGNIEQAVADYSKAIELNPRYAEVYYNRGRVFHLLGKHEEATADYGTCRRLAREQNLGDLSAKVRKITS